MEINEAIKIYNELRNNDIVKKYCEALHIVIKKSGEEKRKAEYYKSSKKYDYYIEKPYKKLVIGIDGAYWKKNGYNSVGVINNGKQKTTDYSDYNLNFCLSLCNYSKEKIKNLIEEHILEDNAYKIEKER